MTKGIDPDRVAIYIRWSTDDQSQGTTLATQQEGCRHYLLSQGWRVSADLTFVDDGYSGGSLDRPALTRLRGAVRAGRVDCVVVFKLDRLSRSVVDTVKLVLEEWEGRVFVKSAREPIDTSTPHGKVLFYILASYAEWERNLIRERTHAGQRQRARAGRNPGIRIPYGYRVGDSPGTLTVIPSEAATVRRIYRLYGAGSGARRLAALLNAEGVPYRGGKPWNEQTLRYLLQNPIYCGELVYGRRTRNPRYGKAPGERYWVAQDSPIRVEATPHIPAIVDRAEFLAAQGVRRRRSGRTGGGQTGGARVGRANASTHLLTGAARCRCGYGLYLKVSCKGTRRYFAYACRGKKLRGVGFCGAANLPRDALDAAVAQGLRTRFAGALRTPALLARGRRTIDQEQAAAAAALPAARAELERLQRESRRVRRDYRQGLLDAGVFSRLQAEIDAELGTARRRMAAAAAHLTRLQAGNKSAARLQAQLAAPDPWQALTAAEQKSLVKLLLPGLVAYRAADSDRIDVELVWATADPCDPGDGSQIVGLVESDAPR